MPLFDLSATMQVVYLVQEVRRGLSAKGSWHVLPGGDRGFKRSLAGLKLTRCRCAAGHIHASHSAALKEPQAPEKDL